jgi:2-polyprenyl-6-methoxyphenol hydroxylase-like FAD-dependent oxidoreductase
MEEVDVAIAGGGPAGLAVANAIRSVYGDSVTVKVFDKE